MTPNLLYAQAIRGRFTGRGVPRGPHAVHEYAVIAHAFFALGDG